jgi:hypothetical protein
MADSLFSLASVFTETGLVLWERFHVDSGSSEEQSRDAINELIQNVLLQERSLESNRYISERGHQDVRFVKDNQCGSTLVFALVIASTLANVGKVSSLMERLIEAFRTSFVSEFRSLLSNSCDYSPEFKMFDDIWVRLQGGVQQSRSEKGPRAFEKKDSSKLDDEKSKDVEGNFEKLSHSPSLAASSDQFVTASGDDLSEEEKIARARAKLALRAKGSTGSSKSSAATKATSTPPSKKKSWKDQAGISVPSKLDYSVGSAPKEELLDDSKFTFNLAIDESSDEEHSSAGVVKPASAPGRLLRGGNSSSASGEPGKSKGWWQSIMTMTGNTAVDAADIQPAMQQFRDMLIQKNVAADIAENITTAVCDSLVGKKISGIYGIKQAAKDAM